MGHPIVWQLSAEAVWKRILLSQLSARHYTVGLEWRPYFWNLAALKAFVGQPVPLYS